MEEETPKEVNSRARVIDLLHRCNNADKPDTEARKELHQLIQAKPTYKQAIMQSQEDLYPVVLRARIESIKFSDTQKEFLYIKCDQLREELGYFSANQLEKLAIEQIVLCWVNYHQLEIQYVQNLSGSHSFEAGIYWEKRLAFASRRYNRALEMLSRMRKMSLVVQVNTANNQIINNGDR